MTIHPLLLEPTLEDHIYENLSIKQLLRLFREWRNAPKISCRGIANG